VPCTGFSRKTVYLLSTQGGNAYVEIDPVGQNQWNEFYGEKVAANKFWKYTTNEGFDRIRLKFAPIKNAKTSAWLILEK